MKQSPYPVEGSPELTRRHDVDWLRVLGMMAVFLFHCGRFFDTEGWHVKSLRTSEVVSFLTLIIAVQWMMPLFFVLSGISTYHSLAHPELAAVPRFAVQAFGRAAGVRHLCRDRPLPGLPRTCQPRTVLRLVLEFLPALLRGLVQSSAAISPGWDCTCGIWSFCSFSR